MRSPTPPSPPHHRRLAAGGSFGALLAAATACGLLSGRPAVVAAPAGGTAYDCRWLDADIRIDGALDEPAWRAAPRLDRFRVPGEGGGKPASRATRARLLWDRQHLYFAAEMDDPDLVATITEHDGRLWENDVFEIFLKPGDGFPGYYEFEFSPNGAVLDMFLPSRGAGGYESVKSEGRFHVEKAIRVRGTLSRSGDRDGGWTIEGRIPWTDLLRTGGRPEPGETWRFALCRADYSAGRREPELSSSAPLTRPDFHRYEDYGRLRFAGPPTLERPLLTTSRVVGAPDPPPPYRANRVFPRLRLTNPVMVVRQPVGDAYLGIVQEYGGGPSRVIRFADNPDAAQFEELLKLDRSAYEIIFHPRFRENGYLYIGAKGPLALEPAQRRMRISRYRMDPRPPYRLDPDSETAIIEWPSDGHDGGAMVFGHDGMLYITTGDGTSDSDVNVRGQEMTQLTAKLLRIDVERPDPGRHYSVPPDNPFVGRAGIAPETWAYGFRNPWRMTIDEKTGHIWVGNNGQDLWESAYLIRKGANYGWSVYEGSHPFYPNRQLGPTPFVPPTLEHHHSEARSLTGGVVYYGARYPELQGCYIYGDYSTGKIWAARHDGTKLLLHREIADTTLQITHFAVDAAGEILITDNRPGGEGGIYTLDPTPKDLPPANFPRKLSDSGLFRDVSDHQLLPSLVPFEVNAPLWSDGAHKARYLGVPGDGKIDFTTYRGWNFPDGTVIVKSFALDMREGDPSSRRWIETRFLTKQEGEWVGYSYEWNDEQTEATLVEKEGKDREYRVRAPRSEEAPDGIRVQKWRYPSRAECMVCHSRAANFVLGLNVMQFNREHDFGGRRENQMERLERAGMLRVNMAAEAADLLRRQGRRDGVPEAELDAYMARHLPQAGQRPAPVSALLALPAERYPRAVDPYDETQDLAARARSYLHGNCSGCHVEAGGGNAQMELELNTPAERMRIFDVRPLHHTFDLPDARLVARGRPEASVLLHRMAKRGEGQMPPLASARVDRQAVRLFTEWIRASGRSR